MAGKLVILTFAFAFLLSGCCGITEDIEPTSGGAGTGTGTGAGTSGGQTGGTTGTNDSGAGTGTTGGDTSGADNLLGLDYSGLVALGVPVECDVTIQNPTETFNVKMFFKGGDEFRSEYSSSEQDMSECQKIISIYKQDTLYVGCEGEQVIPDMGCDWMEFEATEESGSFSSDDLDDVPPSSWSCKPWIYDASKFAVTGKSCSLEDMFADIPDDAYEYT
jgi:uncharacterized protein YceK